MRKEGKEGEGRGEMGTGNRGREKWLKRSKGAYTTTYIDDVEQDGDDHDEGQDLAEARAPLAVLVGDVRLVHGPEANGVEGAPGVEQHVDDPGLRLRAVAVRPHGEPEFEDGPEDSAKADGALQKRYRQLFQVIDATGAGRRCGPRLLRLDVVPFLLQVAVPFFELLADVFNGIKVQDVKPYDPTVAAVAVAARVKELFRETGEF